MPYPKNWSVTRRRAYERARDGDGFIYLAEIVGTDKIKIGFSLRPEKRISALYPYLVGEDGRATRLVIAVPGTHAQEREMHKALSRHPARLGAEFYHRSILNHPAIPAGLREAQ